MSDIKSLLDRLRKLLDKLGYVKHGQYVSAEHHNALAEAWSIVSQILDRLSTPVPKPTLKELRRVRDHLDVILPEDNNMRVDNAEAVLNWIHELSKQYPFLYNDYSALYGHYTRMRRVSYGDYVSREDINAQVDFLKTFADVVEHLLAFVSGIEVTHTVTAQVRYPRTDIVKRIKVRPWIRYPRTDLLGTRISVLPVTVVYHILRVTGASLTVNYSVRYPKTSLTGASISVSSEVRYPKAEVSGASLSVSYEIHVTKTVSLTGASIAASGSVRYPRIDVAGASISVSGEVRYPKASLSGPTITVSYTVTKV